MSWSVDVTFGFGCKASCQYRHMKRLNTFPFLSSGWFAKTQIVNCSLSRRMNVGASLNTVYIPGSHLLL